MSIFKKRKNLNKWGMPIIDDLKLAQHDALIDVSDAFVYIQPDVMSDVDLNILYEICSYYAAKANDQIVSRLGLKEEMENNLLKDEPND